MQPPHGCAQKRGSSLELACKKDVHQIRDRD